MLTGLKIKAAALAVTVQALAFLAYAPAAHAGDYCYESYQCVDWNICADAWSWCNSQNPYPACQVAWPTGCGFSSECNFQTGGFYPYVVHCYYEISR